MSREHAHEEELAAALAEFLDRQAREENPSIESFLREYPDLACELRPAIEAVAEIDSVVTLPPQVSLPLPERLSGHRVLAELGYGGMGRVFLAEDEGLGRKVAIKTLSPRLAGDPVLRERFMQEARAMARLNHPGIVRIYSLGPADEPPHFVMEYLEGAPLTEAARATLFRSGRRNSCTGFVLACRLPAREPRLHRDLKPANILVGLRPRTEAARFRPGARHRRRCAVAHAARPDPRHARLRLARAGGGRTARRAQRHLLARGDPVRTADRAVAVCRPHAIGPGASHSRAGSGSAAAAQSRCARRVYRTSASRRSRRIAPIAMLRRARWPPISSDFWRVNPCSPHRLPTHASWPGRVGEHLERPRKLASRPDPERGRVRRPAQRL